MGVSERCEALKKTDFRVRSGHVVAASFPAERLEAALGHAPLIGMIHRAELVESLAECLPKDVAIYGCQLGTLREEGEQVTLEFTNGRRDVVDLVIGADGIHSTQILQ